MQPQAATVLIPYFLALLLLVVEAAAETDSITAMAMLAVLAGVQVNLQGIWAALVHQDKVTLVAPLAVRKAVLVVAALEPLGLLVMLAPLTEALA
jgi:hypothetical protein